MESLISLVASAASNTESGGIFGALGIDWKILIFQVIAFGVLVFILAKWVYPPILAMLDRRQKLIDDSVKAAKDAIAKSEKTAAEIADQLKQAHSAADDIISTAHKQSDQMLLAAEDEAQKRAEAIVASARDQLQRDVEAARKMLRAETVELIAEATEKVVGEKVDSGKDAKLIAEAMAESEKKGMDQ